MGMTTSDIIQCTVPTSVEPPYCLSLGVQGLLRGSNSDGGRAVRRLACKEAAAAVVLLQEACKQGGEGGSVPAAGGDGLEGDEAEAMAEMLREGLATLADMQEPADGSRPQQLEYPQCMQFLQSVLPHKAAAEVNLVVIQEGAVGLGPQPGNVAPAGLQVSCHLSEEVSQGLAAAQARGQEFTLPMETTCVVYLAAGHYQALALRGSNLRVGYPRAAEGPTGPHEGGVLLLARQTVQGSGGGAGQGGSGGRTTLSSCVSRVEANGMGAGREAPRGASPAAGTGAPLCGGMAAGVGVLSSMGSPVSRREGSPDVGQRLFLQVAQHGQVLEEERLGQESLHNSMPARMQVLGAPQQGAQPAVSRAGQPAAGSPVSSAGRVGSPPPVPPGARVQGPLTSTGTKNIQEYEGKD